MKTTVKQLRPGLLWNLYQHFKPGTIPKTTCEYYAAIIDGVATWFMFTGPAYFLILVGIVIPIIILGVLPDSIPASSGFELMLGIFLTILFMASFMGMMIRIVKCGISLYERFCLVRWLSRILSVGLIVTGVIFAMIERSEWPQGDYSATSYSSGESAGYQLPPISFSWGGLVNDLLPLLILAVAIIVMWIIRRFFLALSKKLEPRVCKRVMPPLGFEPQPALPPV